jgi:Esterase-like activity of phytase
MPRRRWLLAIILALALAPGTWLRSPELLPNHEQVLRFTPLALEAEQLGPFHLAAVWDLTSPNSLFGSYSAVVAPAPGRLLAFSDRGEFLDFAVPGSEPGPIRIGTLPGKALRYKRYRDIEAASRDPATGRLFLTFEGQNVVARYGPDLSLEALRAVPEMRHWNDNTGPEAMVRLGDGRFVVLCECTSGLFASGEHPALMFTGDPAAPGAASYFTFSGAAGYRPTDLALLPDGRVLVLVRRLTWPMPPRFKAKLLLADPAGITPGGIWHTTELASIDAPLPVDNFEALTVTADDAGKLTAWLLSDDNQALTQRTLLVQLEFSLADLPAKQKAPGTPDAPR